MRVGIAAEYGQAERYRRRLSKVTALESRGDQDSMKTPPGRGVFAIAATLHRRGVEISTLTARLLERLNTIRLIIPFT